MARYRVGLETRERILAATRHLLGEEGFEAVTLKAITERAGVGAGSFYNLFASKEEAVVEAAREAILAVDPDPSGLGDETVADLVHAFVRFFVDPDTAAVARIYLQLASGTGLTDARMARHLRRSHDARVQRFTAAARRAGNGMSDDQADRTAERLLAALTGFAVTWLIDPGFDFPGHAQDLLDAEGLAGS